MGKVSVWTGFSIATWLWVLISIVSIVVGYLIYFGWGKTIPIHPLIWILITAVIVFIVAIPYLRYIEKKSQ